MHKLSDFFSKPVLSIYEGLNEGIIKTALFDKKYKRLKYLVLFDDNDDIIEEKIIKLDKIYNVGLDAITIRNSSNINLSKSVNIENEIENPINSKVYDTLGNYKGSVIEVNLDDKFNVYSLKLNNETEILISSLLSANNNYIIIQNTIKATTLNNFSHKVKFLKVPSKNNQVYALLSEKSNDIIKEKIEQSLNQNNNIQPIDIANSITKELKKSETTLPNRITTNVNFLMGRKATKNIYSQSNEIIIKKNSIINSDNIEIARKYGRIKELSTYSM